MPGVGVGVAIVPVPVPVPRAGAAGRAGAIWMRRAVSTPSLPSVPSALIRVPTVMEFNDADDDVDVDVAAPGRPPSA